MNQHGRGQMFPATNSPTIDVQVAQSSIVVAATGEIDVGNVDVLRREFHRAASGSDIVIADLTAVQYIDSSTIELLVVTSQELRSKRGELRIVAPSNGRVRRVLAISGVEQELSLHETKEAATSRR